MRDKPPIDIAAPLLTRLLRRRRQARLVLLFERLWPALWPPLGLVGAFLCLALLDLPPLLPPLAHALLLLALAVAIAGTLVRGLRRLRLPDAADADRRLEVASGLRHRPLSVLTDRPVLPGAEALWRTHVARTIAQLGRLRVGPPRPGLAAIDRRALRGGLIVALVACFVVAGPDAPDRVRRALTPEFQPVPAAAATELQAWITPPGYADMAPVFLHPDGGAVSVPAGSHLTVSVSGGHGWPALTLAGRTLPFQPLDASTFQADEDLTGGGRLIVRRAGSELGAWDLTVVADRAPIVTWPEPPGVARGSRIAPRTRLPWQVAHEYGVVSLQAELRLKDRPDAPPFVVRIPLPGGVPKQARGAYVQDLTPHPWAGLPVVARLVARDVPGVTGTSDDATFTLPERRFANPTARAIIAVRKGLTLHPDARAAAIAELDRIGGLTAVWQDDPGGYLTLRAARARLSRDGAAAVVPEVQAELWQLALRLEEGLTDRTARALAQARQALRDAMDAAKQGKATPQEIERRIEALELAIQQHLQALAEQLRRDPGAQMADPGSQQMNADDLQKRAEQMRRDVEQGRMQDAEQQMAQLEKMLDALQHARPMHRDAEARRRDQQRQRGRQQLNAVQDMVQREAGLLDHAESRASTPADPAQANADTVGRQHDARVQRALRRALGELMQQYGDLMGKIPPNLGDADQAMHGAAQNFAQGADDAAAGDVRRAIAALQKGGQAMSQQMAQAFGMSGQQEGDQQGDQDGPGVALGNPQEGDQNGGGAGDQPSNGEPSFGRRADRHLDPFGRELREGANGTDESSDVTLPEQMEQARTRAIQEELRRRAGERSRPQQELDYINRLLKQF